MSMNDEEKMHIDTGLTLDQLEEMQSAAKAGVCLDEALKNMGDELDLSNEDLLAQLRYAHSVGMDDRREMVAEIVADMEKAERVYTEEETKANAQSFLNPILPLFVKHISDKTPINGQTMDNRPISKAFDEMRDKVMGGDRTYLYDCILSQMGQMQQMSLKLNGYMGGTDKIDTIMKYSNMQMKLMAEQRRTIQALDDLMNPKRTTFVKEVSQHNHFPEKKDDIPNELPATKEEDAIDAVTYSETATRV